MRRRKVLIVDDTENFRQALAENLVLTDRYTVLQAAGAGSGLAIVREQSDIDCIILDYDLRKGGHPRMSGLEMIEQLDAIAPHIPVIMISGITEGRGSVAVESIRSHAVAFLDKPFATSTLLELLEQTLGAPDEGGNDDDAQNQLERAGFISRSPIMTKVCRDALVAARNEDLTVLIVGETGTGKEVLAQAIHALSDRRSKPFVAENCATINKEFFASTLFGHVKSAFNDAHDKRGLLQEAGNGTAFLDEITEMPSDVQAGLLRAMETRSFRRLGENTLQSLDARIIAATNRSIAEAIRDHHLREDLRYRFDMVIALPPLRRRTEEIGPIVEAFLRRRSEATGRPAATLDEKALATLQRQPWLGNVRQVLSIVKVAAAEARDGVITHDAIAEKLREEYGITGRDQWMEELEVHGDLDATMEMIRKRYIIAALWHANGRVSAAAERLGYATRDGLKYWLEKYRIDPHTFEGRPHPLDHFLRLYLRLLLILFISLSGCAKVDRGRLVPESLPYSLALIDEGVRSPGTITQICTSFDSSSGDDAVLWLDDLSLCEQNMKAKAFLFGGTASITASDQRTITLSAFPDLRQVNIRFPPVDLNNNGTRDYLFSFVYDDSVVVHAEDALLPGPYRSIFDVAIPTPRRNFIHIDYPVWHVSTTGDMIIPFKSSNKQRSAAVYDTLYFYSLPRRRIVTTIPVGATLGDLCIDGRQSVLSIHDSLLVLESVDDNWALPSLNGLDHNHRHLVAFRPDGSIAWIDTLDDGSARKKFQTRSLLIHASTRIITASSPVESRDTSGSLVQLFEESTGRELARWRSPQRILSLHRHGTREGMEEIIAAAHDGTIIRLDSLLHPREVRRLPVELDHDPVAIAGTPEFDLDGDDVNDLILVNSIRQAMVVSGADLSPLCALERSPALSGICMVRTKGRATRILANSDQLRLYEVEPTPLLTRIGAHREKLTWLLWPLAILALPLAFYAMRRILYLRSLFGSLTSRSEQSAVVTFDGHGRASSFNDAASRIFGLHGRTKVYGGEDLPEEIAAMIGRTLTRKETLLRDVVIGADEQRYLAVATTPLRRLGSRSGCLLIATEATELVEAELRRNALLLARAKAHDAKQPLGTIELQFDAMMTMLRRAYGEMPRGVEDLERRIGDELSDAADRVRAIMHMADVAEFTPATADLTNAVERWLQKNRGRYERDAITFTLEVDPPLNRIALDEGHLSILLQCACDNASEAMAGRRERSVTLRLRSNLAATILEIIDTGIGMDNVMLERLRTQPYYTNRANGTGFGMKIIRKVCEAHHAELAIDSTLMRGTTVRIAFPAAIAQSASSPESAPSGSRTALQVDHS